MQRVARIDRLFPPQLVDAGRAEPGLLVLDDWRAITAMVIAARVPAARRDAAEMGLGRFLVGQMKGLGVVLARELQHFLAGHLIGAELGLGADLQVLEIVHAAAHSGDRGLARVRARLGWPWPRIPDPGALASAPDGGGGGDATTIGSTSPSAFSSRTSRKTRSTSRAIRMLAELAARIGG